MKPHFKFIFGNWFVYRHRYDTIIPQAKGRTVIIAWQKYTGYRK